MKKILYVAALLALLAVPFIVVSAEGDDVPLVTLCHARPADTAANGWVTKTIPRAAVFSQGHASKHDADIIPPFGDFAGKNWDADGQAILQNGCVVPEPIPVPIQLFNNCNRWVVKQGDVELDKGQWTLPFELESAESDFWEGTINEPEKCYEACQEGNTYEVKGLSSPSPWSEWEWNGQQFERSRVIHTAYQIRDNETDELCGIRSEETTEWQYRDPDEALVGVSLICHVPAGDGVVYQLTFSVTVEPAGGATVFFNGNEYTESTGGYIGFGRYDWSAEASDGFEIVGDDEGTVKLKRDDCNAEEPPEHPPTGADPNTVLAVVIGLAGYALAGIGGSILFMKRRASR